MNASGSLIQATLRRFTEFHPGIRDLMWWMKAPGRTWKWTSSRHALKLLALAGYPHEIVAEAEKRAVRAAGRFL